MTDKIEKPKISIGDKDYIKRLIEETFGKIEKKEEK